MLGGGNVALVCGAERDGHAVVLKVHPRGHREERELAGEAAALGAWSGSGAAVELLAQRDRGLTLLLERVSPGLPLDESGLAGGRRLEVLGEVARRIHRLSGEAPAGVFGLAEYCSPWRGVLAGTPESLEELDALLGTSPEPVVLHSDLHGGNVLAHDDGWVAIDPHGLIGDRNAEIWSLIDPLSPVLDADPAAARAAVAAFAAAAELDPVRASRWARLRAVAEARTIEVDEAADADDRIWATKMLHFAAALDRRL